MSQILEQIKLVEPQATSFYEGKNSFIVVLGNGQKVCISKQLAEGMKKQCLNCKQVVRIFRGQNGWVKFNLDGSKHHDLRKRQ